jgi:transcriptional regulator with XRE-family HTH domain
MARTSNGRPRGAQRGQVTSGDERELTRLKLDLVAAREQGEHGALGRLLAAHPGQGAALTEFAAALAATSGYERETPTPETAAVAERALARALSAAFPAAAVSAAASATESLGARALASLKALRRARGLTLAAAARRLGLGLDVLSDLEAGLIAAASVPERLTRALGELLETTAEQVHAALESQPAVRPALLRDRSQGGEVPVRDFAEAVRRSPSMSAEQKADWLGD